MKIRTLTISSVLFITFFALCKAEDDAIPLDKTPVAVQQTIKNVIAGGKIKEIEKETKDGAITYEVTYASTKGEKAEAVISSSGQVLKNGPDEDKNEEKGGKDKD